MAIDSIPFQLLNNSDTFLSMTAYYSLIVIRAL
jgi:hypothetical protein